MLVILIFRFNICTLKSWQTLQLENKKIVNIYILKNYTTLYKRILKKKKVNIFTINYSSFYWVFYFYRNLYRALAYWFERSPMGRETAVQSQFESY